MARSWDYIVVGAGSVGSLVSSHLAAAGGSKVLHVQQQTPPRHTREPRLVVRPHVLEFDAWVASGAQQWAPEDVLPWFRSLETDHDFGGHRSHGNHGPISVRRSAEPHWTATDRLFQAGAFSMGHPSAPDHNAVGILGVSPQAMTSTAAEMMTEQALANHLEEDTPGYEPLVVKSIERLRWSGQRATGIDVLTETGPERLNGTQLVLCAGGVGSPALLLRSGIGPADQLQQIGIEVVQDLPVGQHVQTHPLVYFPGAGPSSSTERATTSTGMIARWNSGVEGSTSGDLMAWTRRMSGNEVLESYREGQLAYPVGDDSVLGTVAQVWSRGSLRLTGGSSADPLNVDPGLLTDPLDSHRMLLVVRHLKALLSSQGAQAHPISWVDGRFIQELPEEDHQSILRWAKQAVAPASDLAAGCRIGHGGDNSSVVDYQGQVHGIDGVSVADLSIVPALVKADPWLTGMVVGRRVAEFLQPSDPATT